MTAGAPISQAEIYNRAAAVARQVHAVMAEIGKFGDFMAGMPDATLTSTYSISGQDLADLRSATNDLVDLTKVWSNQASARVTGTYDYRQFVKRLIGVGVY